MDLEVIIARYTEDVSWTSLLKYPFKIFNKNLADSHLFELNLPNVGREGHTHFSYIVNNYKNLPNFIAFLQGNPFDHCKNVITNINEFKFNNSFLPLGNIFEERLVEYPHILQEVTEYSKKIGFEIKQPLFYVPGAQYIISRDLILTKPLDFYKKILSSVSEGIYPLDGLNIEKTLFQLYGLHYI
jgi:hypothetical protein